MTVPNYDQSGRHVLVRFERSHRVKELYSDQPVSDQTLDCDEYRAECLPRYVSLKQAIDSRKGFHAA